jgi:hypothetical protein
MASHAAISAASAELRRIFARASRRLRLPSGAKHQQVEALARTAQGETLTAIARNYNVSHDDYWAKCQIR